MAMALVESAEQLALQENQFICTQLDYPRIVSHLIQAGIITQEQNTQIEEAFIDNAGRMQELISILIKLNFETSLDAFREAVIQLGEMALALKLSHDLSSFGIPLNAQDAHPCLFVPEVLSHILSYLTQNDLITARLVCKTWNAVYTACHMQKFTARFRNDSGHQQMVEFVSTGSKSAFCKRLNRYSLDIAIMEPSGWVFYKTFFLLFGSNLQYLELGRSLNKDLLEFIFSPEIKQYLTNLKHLEMFVFPDKGLIQIDSLSFLSGLETLTLTKSCSKPSDKYLHFMKIFVNSYQKLKDNTSLGLVAFPSHSEIQLKAINFPLSNVSPEVFRDFISSHKRSIKWLKISILSRDNPTELIEVLPHMENLVNLNLYSDINNGGFGDFISSLKFCTRAPNLKVLTVRRVGSPIISKVVLQPTFVHEGLNQLRIDFYDKSTADGIPGYLSRVPQYFPNLMKLEVHARNVVWPVQLEHLKLQPEYEVNIWH